MEYYYTFIKDNEYITAKGSGDDPHNLKIKWVSSPNASGVLKQIMAQASGYSPTIGFVSFDKFPKDFYIQISRFGSIYKDGWRFKDTNLPAIPAESTELGKAKTKKRVYVKASAGRKAHYRMQEVGREEVAPVENLWEITADQFGRLVSGSKIPLQAKYIEEHSDPDNLLDVTDAMLKKAYPQELEDTKRSAKMRKKIFDKLPKEFKNGYCPETMNLHLHADVAQYAAKYGFDISPEVKKEYPMLFKGVPINFSPTGDKESDAAINAILEKVRDEVLDPMSTTGVGSMHGIFTTVIDSIGSTGESVNAEVAVVDSKSGTLIREGMGDISNLIGPDLLNQIKDGGVNIRIKYRPEWNRSNFVNEDSTINLSKDVLNTEAMTYSDSTICHEYGHAIEYMVPEVKSLCGEFLDRRTRDDAMTPLNEVCPGMGYADNEVTRVDRFMSPYIGKHYSDRCTEVLSMGMGYLTSETDIQQMFVEDPEYLGFVLAVMSGRIGSKKVEKDLMFEINLSKLNT